MKMNSKFLNFPSIVGIVVLLLVASAQAVVVSQTPASLYDLFPQNTQGTNGIRLQYRAGGTSTYTDLSYGGVYTWWTAGAPYNLPFVIRSGTAGTILAEPSAVAAAGADRDPVIRVLVQGKFNQIRVQGRVRQTGGIMTWYIYKGATNWAAPLWESSFAADFDFEVSCTSGEELFFAVDAGANDTGDHGQWQDVTLTAMPTFFPIGVMPTSVYDLFPKDAQGTNGIQLQRRQPGTSVYTDLQHGGDYIWNSPAYHYSLPFIQRAPGVLGKIPAEPLDDGSTVLDPVMRILLVMDPGVSVVRVQGTAGNGGIWPVLLYIYRGATNWGTPLWQSAGNQSFDFTVNCSSGDELFFAVNAAGGDASDHSYWQDLALSTPPLQIWTAVEVGSYTVTGRWYQVQYVTNVNDTNWLPVGTNILGNGGVMSAFDSTRYSGQRFYRMVPLP
jgi:hypothetical protein